MSNTPRIRKSDNRAPFDLLKQMLEQHRGRAGRIANTTEGFLGQVLQAAYRGDSLTRSAHTLQVTPEELNDAAEAMLKGVSKANARRRQAGA